MKILPDDVKKARDLYDQICTVFEVIDTTTDQQYLVPRQFLIDVLQIAVDKIEWDLEAHCRAVEAAGGPLTGDGMT